MYVTCDCGSDTFHIDLVELSPIRVMAECAECGNRVEVNSK